MSVVVRMEMPKDCWDCPFVNGEFGYCQVDKEERQIEDTYGRPSWCPIICSIPEWHGRLVDERELFARCRPVKNFDNPDSLVIVQGAIIQSQTIVPADAERSET